MADTLSSSALTESPLLLFNFFLDLDGKEADGFFTEISGLGSETEIVEQLVTNSKGDAVVLKIPGKLTWGDVELKRGVTSNMGLWDWRELVVQGKTRDARKNGSITMLDSEQNAVAIWEIVNAWPSKISGPELSVESNGIGIESITIVHEGIKRTQ